jgi:hypothetical protein
MIRISSQQLIVQERMKPYVPSNCTTFEELAPIETMLNNTPGASLSQQVMQRKDIAETYNFYLI